MPFLQHSRWLRVAFILCAFLSLPFVGFSAADSLSTLAMRLQQARKASAQEDIPAALDLYLQVQTTQPTSTPTPFTLEALLGEGECLLHFSATETQKRAFLQRLDQRLPLIKSPLVAARLLVFAALHTHALSLADQAWHYLRLAEHNYVQSAPTTRDQAYYAFAEASLLMERNQFARAVAAFKRCIQRTAQTPSLGKLNAIAYRDISLALDELGDKDQAEAYARQSILLHEEAFGPLHVETANAYRRLGHTYVTVDRNSEALENYLHAYHILNQLYDSHHPSVLKSYNGLANVYHNLQDSIKARQYYLLALKGYQESEGDSSTGSRNAYHNLGIHYFDCGRYDLARQYWELANRIIRYNQGAQHLDQVEHQIWIGETWHEQGHPLRAIQDYHTAYYLLVPHAPRLGRHEIPLATLSGWGNKQIAVIAVEKGVSLLAEHERSRDPRDLQAAYHCLEHGLNVMDSIRAGYHGTDAQLGILEFSYQYQEAILEACMRSYTQTASPLWLDRAFMWMERGKSNLLNAAIRASAASQQGTQEKVWHAQEKRLRHRIDSLDLQLHHMLSKAQPGAQANVKAAKQALFNAQAELHSFLSNLADCDARYYQFRFMTQPLPLSEVLAALPHTQGSFVEYFVGKENYYILLANQQHRRLLRFPVAGLDQSINDFLAHFQPDRVHAIGGKAQLIASAQDLYRRLVAPYAHLLHPDAPLQIVPDGKLGHVPFEALLQDTPIELGTPYARLPFLLRQYPIAYASSATALLATQPRVRSRSELRLLAMAPSFQNPETRFADAGRAELTHLPNAPKEVQQLAQYMSGDVLIGTEATEAKFKEVVGQYNVLHFATHGTIQDDNPLWSNIAFTQTGEGVEDGRLHTMELFNMDLKADLAVLSACNTGNGKLLRGEGIMSLARGFMYAGCPSIVMSLWSVDDAASAKIMETFYSRLAKGDSKDKALRTAKLDYLDQAPDSKAHPYYWAAHVLIGETRGFHTAYQGLAYAGIVLCLVGLIVFAEVRKGY